MAMPVRPVPSLNRRLVALPSPAEPSDAALVERVLRGDRAAEEAIYRRHVSYVTGLSTRLVRRRADVQDIVQDTFADVFEQLPALREPERLLHWITGIAVHKAHRRFRRLRLAALFGRQVREVDPLPSLLPAPSL